MMFPYRCTINENIPGRHNWSIRHWSKFGHGVHWLNRNRRIVRFKRNFHGKIALLSNLYCKISFIGFLFFFLPLPLPLFLSFPYLPLPPLLFFDFCLLLLCLLFVRDWEDFDFSCFAPWIRSLAQSINACHVGDKNQVEIRWYKKRRHRFIVIVAKRKIRRIGTASTKIAKNVCTGNGIP